MPDNPDKVQDHSNLDAKYFIDPHVYNCPFCNRRHVRYEIYDNQVFQWTADKWCRVYFVKCKSCECRSMHLSFSELRAKEERPGYQPQYVSRFMEGLDLDSLIFYSVPSSFFVVDARIPKLIRELITEAEGCLKMNFLTGASACMRKAIYELLIKEKAEGANYEDRTKSLKTKYADIDPMLFDVLGHIQNMTSDKVHEQSWDKWDSKNLTLIIETLKTVLHEIYVLPQIKADRSRRIEELRAAVNRPKPA